MKCLIIDSVHEAIAQELGKFMQVDHKMLPTQAELAEIIPEYDVLIMRVDPAINKEILDAAKNLKVIGVCSVGLNHIDMETAKAKGIQVFNAPGLNANAVVELTISKMLDLSRNTMAANHDVKVNHQWDKYKYVGRELRGRTLGIVGFGRIGRRLGEIARAFGMTILAYDPYLKPEPFTCTFSYTGKHREAVLLLRNIINELLDKHRLAYTGATKQTDFTAVSYTHLDV